MFEVGGDGMADWHVLQDAAHRRVVRIGNAVHRPVYAWTPAVHALLRHLTSLGFRYSPRVLGFDERGREVLSYIEGESGRSGWSHVVSDAGLAAFARLLREYHGAVSRFRPPGNTQWAVSVGAPGDGEVVCHGDFGPWNVVWRGTEPVGILDWDYAHPAPPIHDVAYALEYVAPFRDDRTCLRWLRYPAPPDRRRRMALFAESYGLPSTSGLVDAVLDVQRQVASTVQRLAAEGHEPQVTWIREGYLNELQARMRWTEENRLAFE